MRSLFLALHLSATSAWAGPDGPSKFDATALGAQRAATSPKIFTMS